MAKTKKQLSIVVLVIAVLLLLSITFVACNKTETDTNIVRLGNTTQAAGNFRFLSIGASSVNAADQDIVQLTSGYSTMEPNRNGEYVWNQTVVKAHNEEEVSHEDGSLTYKVTIEINPGLYYSDGTTELKAADFLVGPLAFSTDVSKAGLGSNTTGASFVGYAAYSSYKGSPEEGASQYFSGLHLLSDYKFSMEIASDYYPYYYASLYTAISPYNLKLVLGEGVTVAENENGAYLEGNWFEKNEAGDYLHADHLKEAKFDYTTYPYSGPYYLESWNSSTSVATLKLNQHFAGNFEGQKPHIGTVTYSYVPQETAMQAFKAGQIDVYAGVTGASDTNAALQMLSENPDKYKESHYDRAGYGKVQFDCDFGPTMFASVRQAIAFLLDRDEFAQTFTGGYGSVVNGPYCNSFAAYDALESELNTKLNSYDFSVEQAKKALEDDGWIYNANGGHYTSGIRYKKLTAEEAEGFESAKDANKTYQSVGTGANGTVTGTYKTVQIGGDYYMPCFVNWFGSDGNEVTELLNTMLVQSSNLESVGMGIALTTGDFDLLLANMSRESDGGYSGTPTYGMYNMATGWSSAIFDYSWTWSFDMAYFPYSSNKLFDEYDLAFPYFKNADGSMGFINEQGVQEGTHTKMSFDEAYEAADGKLGMDYISWAMVYDVEPGDTEEYNKWWLQYQIRWNELLPDIPLYSNIYYDLYSAKLEGFSTSPFFGPEQAILYCTIAG